MNPQTELLQINYRLKAQRSFTTEVINQVEKLAKQMRQEEFILKMISTKLKDLQQANPQAVVEFKAKIANVIQHDSNAELIRPPLIISSNSNQSFGAALAPDTENSLRKGKLVQSYPVSFRGNPKRAKSHHNYLETYPEDKPPETPFVSAWDAYSFYNEKLNETEEYQLMVEITIAKFRQHPRLAETIKRNGGKRWITNCSYLPQVKDKWAGKGLDSKYLTALTEAYAIIYPEDNIFRDLPKDKQNSTPPAEKNQTNLISLAPWLDYNAKVKVVLIYFQSKAKAESWEYHIHQEQYVGDKAEVSKTLKSGFNYQLNISGITEKEAQEIVNLYPEIATELHPPVETKTI